jgi:adenylate cyclase
MAPVRKEAVVKRKIAAILAADVVGYSRLMSEDEEETMRRLVSYRGVFDDFVRNADGRIFNTAGDAVLAEFPSAVDALRAAIDIQESLRTRNLAYPPNRHMVFRMGLTIGDVMERDGDLLGDGVNVAARLQGLADPGGICISRSVHEQVANKLSVIFSDLGPQEIKNISRPIYAYRVEFEKGLSQTSNASAEKTNRPVALYIAIAALLFAVGALGTIVFLSKPWSKQEVANSKELAAAVPTPAGAPASHEKELAHASARTLFGTRFVAEEAPFICDECRERISKALIGQPDHTAVTLSLDGGFYWALNRNTAADARRSSLGQCLDAKRLGCFVYAVDSQIVWSEPAPPLPVKPWFVRDPKAEQPLDFDKIPTLSAEAKQRIAQLYLKFDGKALALGAHRMWGMAGTARTDEEAARIVLERCSYVTHSPCRVIAIKNVFVVPPESFRIDVAAPTFSVAANATGPAYSLPGGPLFVPGNIPFICDECRERTARGLKDQPEHSALVISFDGGFWYTWGQDSAEAARTIALGDCLGASQTMCIVYAVDGQLVSKEVAPLPALPWFTHDPQIEKPVDVDAIPDLPSSAKEVIRTVYMKANSPKAIAVGHGSWAQAFGVKIQLRSESEAARIALERCGFVTQAPCRIVAINGNSVIRPGSE